MSPEERARVVVESAREQLLNAGGTTRHYNTVAHEALLQIKAAVQEEREACARIAEDVGGSGGRTWNDAAQEIAAAIRSRP